MNKILLVFLMIFSSLSIAGEITPRAFSPVSFERLGEEIGNHLGQDVKVVSVEKTFLSGAFRAMILTTTLCVDDASIRKAQLEVIDEGIVYPVKCLITYDNGPISLDYGRVVLHHCKSDEIKIDDIFMTYEDLGAKEKPIGLN